MRNFFFKPFPNAKTTPFQLILLALLCLGLYGVFKLLFVLFPIKESHPDNTWVKTVGTVTNYYARSKYYINYKIDSIDYKEFYGRRGHGRFHGEKYNILVNPKHNQEYYTLLWEPVFSQEEKTATCIGRITRVYTFNWDKEDSFTTNHGIEYSYIIMGSEYERDQRLPPEYTGIFNRLKKGDTFKVEYLIKNPRRSRILLSY